MTEATEYVLTIIMINIITIIITIIISDITMMIKMIVKIQVSQQSMSWIPLLNIKCHPDTQLFLCSLFSPVCL